MAMNTGCPSPLVWLVGRGGREGRVEMGMGEQNWVMMEAGMRID